MINLTEQEKQLVLLVKQRGGTPEQAIQALENLRTGTKPVKQTNVTGAVSKLASGFAKGAGENLQEIQKAGANYIDRSAMGPLSQVVKGPASRLAEAGQQAAGLTQENLNAEGAAETIGKVAGVIATGGALSGLPKLASTGIKSLFKRSASSADDVVKQAQAAIKAETGPLTQAAEAAAPKVSLLERWAGVRPDIKKRISGKTDQLKQYFDVAHARNLDDTVDTPLTLASKRVDEAQTKLEGLLNDTGSDVGAFRNKIATYKASPDDMVAVENSFASQLSRLNLEVVDGQVVPIKGKILKTASSGDIKVLNDLYQALRTVKQSPTLENIIDLRMVADSKINFEKAAREASSSLDPVSRALRSQLAEVGARLVGKEQAATLEKYSSYISTLNDLKSYTDRKAGAEFLLKRVLSERGGDPKRVIADIKEATGIDLMDDAVMSQIATDLIGNEAQKGLFRQELTKSGLDVSALMRGDTKGAIMTAFEKIPEWLFDAEKVFIKASEAVK